MQVEFVPPSLATLAKILPPATVPTPARVIQVDGLVTALSLLLLLEHVILLLCRRGSLTVVLAIPPPECSVLALPLVLVALA